MRELVGKYLFPLGLYLPSYIFNQAVIFGLGWSARVPYVGLLTLLLRLEAIPGLQSCLRYFGDLVGKDEIHVIKKRANLAWGYYIPS